MNVLWYEKAYANSVKSSQIEFLYKKRFLHFLCDLKKKQIRVKLTNIDNQSVMCLCIVFVRCM